MARQGSYIQSTQEILCIICLRGSSQVACLHLSVSGKEKLPSWSDNVLILCCKSKMVAPCKPWCVAASIIVPVISFCAKTILIVINDNTVRHIRLFISKKISKLIIFYPRTIAWINCAIIFEDNYAEGGWNILRGIEVMELSFFIKKDGLVSEMVFPIIIGLGTKKGTTSNLSFLETGACWSCFSCSFNFLER